MKKLAIFVSGSGSDMQSIIDGIEKGQINAKIELVVASKEGIFALERAKKANILSAVYDKNNFSSLEDMYEQIIIRLKELGIDYIILAGYLTILTPNIVKAFTKKIINIHPSLIPKHCGVGYYGMRVHKSVIEAGDKVSGATVHFVDEGADTGDIIAQEQVVVLKDDTPETLQKRVLELEHKLLPKVVAMLCNKKKEKRYEKKSFN